MSAQGRMFRGIVVGLAAATMFAVGPVAANAARPKEGASLAGACQMRFLPVPVAAESGSVTGGDHTGRFLVGQATVFDGTASVLESLLWTDGRLQTLDTSALAPNIGVNVTDVNSNGAVVGYRTTDVITFHTDAWVRRSGRYALLPGLKPNDATTAIAINSAGDIIGTDVDPSVSPAVSHAVIWPADRPGTVRELKIDGASPPRAMGIDIDDDGTALVMLGTVTAPDQRPYIWPARGQGYPLAGPAGTTLPYANALHGGWVAGSALRDAGGGFSTRAVVRWRLPDRIATLVSTEYGDAFAVNRYGTVAVLGALIHRNGRISALGDSAQPAVLSDRGTAAGTYFGSAVVWTGC